MIIIILVILKDNERVKYKFIFETQWNSSTVYGLHYKNHFDINLHFILKYGKKVKTLCRCLLAMETSLTFILKQFFHNLHFVSYSYWLLIKMFQIRPNIYNSNVIFFNISDCLEIMGLKAPDLRLTVHILSPTTATFLTRHRLRRTLKLGI